MRCGQPIFTGGMIAVGVIAACYSGVAQGGSMVTADLGNSPLVATLGAMGTTTLRAHSNQGQMTNATVTTTEMSNGKVVANPPMGVKLAQTQNIVVNKKSYSPPYELKDQSKALIIIPGDSEVLTSVSGRYTAFAQQADLATAPKGRYIAVGAYNPGVGLPPPPPGSGAGYALDPFTVPAGPPYAYAPTIDASLQFGDSSASGGAEFFAVDSSVFTSDDVNNFPDDGSPLEDTLWNLSLSADGPLASTSDVDVDFELNPLALNEIMLPSSYLSSLPRYSDSLTAAEIATLVDGAIDNAIGQALTFDDGTVSLQDFALFPADTLFQAADGGVVYAEGVDAGLTDVPEPATLWLVGAGLFALAGVSLKRRNR
jgi:hypothetical protein